MPNESPQVTSLSLGPLSNLGMGAPKFIGAVKDEWKLFSDRAEDYTIGAPIGFGASSIVYQATWNPQDDSNAMPTPCALKVLDLDSLPPRSLQLLQRETTLMSLSKHPNVLRVRGSWMDGHKLYIALRLMNKGSAADVMRYGWPGGMDEEVIKCILRQALKGLNYLHVNGFIHRDIKAANLLIDDDGTVLLGDLGVAADLSEHPHDRNSHAKSKAHSIPSSLALAPQYTYISTEKRAGKSKEKDTMRPMLGKRKSFVGTPCWMAPELVMGDQYDASADIWSFGITALELAQGHPPRFRESTQKVLLRTLKEDAPSLDREGGTYKYSRAFKEIVDSCLDKDPSKRPTAEQLLQSPFFRSAKKKSYLVNSVLKDLPPLAQRQERRALSPANSPNSIDSWDFPTALISPPGISTISSVGHHRYAALQELVDQEDKEKVFAEDRAAKLAAVHLQHQQQVKKHHTQDAVFEMDGEDLDGDATKTTTPLASASVGGSFHVHYQQHLEPESRTDGMLSSSPGGYTDQDDVETGTEGTEGTDLESTRAVSTAPSSYVAQASFKGSNSVSRDSISYSSSSRPSTGYSSGRPSTGYSSSNTSNSHSQASYDNSGLPSHRTEPMLSTLSKVVTNPGFVRTKDADARGHALMHSPSDPDIRRRKFQGDVAGVDARGKGTVTERGLWRKLTSKVRKPGSRESSRPPRPGSRDGSDNDGTGKNVEKPSKLVSLFASASRGAVGKSES